MFSIAHNYSITHAVTLQEGLKGHAESDKVGCCPYDLR